MSNDIADKIEEFEDKIAEYGNQMYQCNLIEAHDQLMSIQKELTDLLHDYADEQKEECFNELVCPHYERRVSSVGMESWKNLNQMELNKRVLGTPYPEIHTNK